MEGDPACAGEVHLPCLRGDLAGASTFPCAAARLRRAKPAGHDVFEKYGQHQPLNRQAERYAREGVDLSLSTLADQVGGCAALLRPIYELIRAHVFAGGRVHGDDTPVPVLAKGHTATPKRSTTCSSVGQRSLA